MGSAILTYARAGKLVGLRFILPRIRQLEVTSRQGDICCLTLGKSPGSWIGLHGQAPAKWQEQVQAAWVGAVEPGDSSPLPGPPYPGDNPLSTPFFPPSKAPMLAVFSWHGGSLSAVICSLVGLA